MADVLPIPRKRRTRAHIIADQSVNYVERFIIDAGFAAERIVPDYGYDLSATTFDADGYVETGRVLFQVKATDRPRESADRSRVTYDITIEDYNLWMNDPHPVVIVLFDARTRRAYWQYIQRFFQRNPDRRPRAAASYVRVLIPKSQRLNRRAIVFAARCKNNVRKREHGEPDHG